MLEQLLEKSELNINRNSYNDSKPGTVMHASSKEGLFIKTIDGMILVKEIQGENAKKMNISDFLRGTKVEVGSTFE